MVGPPTSDPNAPANTTSATVPGAPGGQSPLDTSGPRASLTPAGIDANSPPPAADPHAEFLKTYATVQVMLNQNRLADAHLELSQWYDNPQLSPSEQQQVNDLLDQLAGTVVYSRQNLLEDVYSVQPGDSLERIAERYNVPWQLLAKINGIADPRYVRSGDQLKVVRGPFDAVVNLQKCELTLFLRGRYAGRFRIGIGQDQSTPEGEFSVKNKVANPTYYGPQGVVDANDPNNPLGERWVDLGNQIGIHGTNDPSSIGRAESRGCIRLSPPDVEDVYDILSIGSKVVIRR
jgi:LysM repeat protein